jgi:hypothetical protein
VTLRVVHDRPEARWLPSRHRFALWRLAAYIRLRWSRPPLERPEHLILSIDRDQTAAEMHGIAAWIFVTTVCYFAAFLPFALPLSILAAIVLAGIAVQIPIVPGGGMLRLLIGDGDHVKIVSVTTMGLLLIASSYVATTTTWARFVAWFFFAIVIINGVAAAILWLLRDFVRDAEERCVR